jgi:hypothetical protein
MIDILSAIYKIGELRRYVQQQLGMLYIQPEGCVIILTARETRVQKAVCQDTGKPAMSSV